MTVRDRHYPKDIHTEDDLDEEQLYEAVISDHMNGHLSNLFVYVKLEIRSLIEETIKINNSQIMALDIKQDNVARRMAEISALRNVLNTPKIAEKRLSKLIDTNQEESE